MNRFPIVILAGGLATRLRPLTNAIPKSLIPIAREPFIAHQLRLLHDNGIREVVICAGFLGEQIVDFVGNGNAFDLSIQYSFDGDTCLGTGGAIKKALPLLGEHFFVLYGDSYLRCDYFAAQKSFIQSHKKGLMTIFRNIDAWDKSNVLFENNAILKYDKVNRTRDMHYIDYGLGIFHKSAFDGIPENTDYDLAILYQSLLKQQQLAAYEVKERFYEIGSMVGIQELEDLLCSLSSNT
jgi:N-acetyl-alpha-D-muramate 1-phosphate uridylyltransferase